MDSEVDQLHSKAESLIAQFEQGEGTSCINEAIELDRAALAQRPPGHPQRSVSLIRLASELSDRYKQFGWVEDLNEAIVLEREALYLRPQGHPDRWISLIYLATDLSTHYEQFGGMKDLDEAIVLHRETLDLCPKGHPHRSMSLNNLAADLSTRYNQLGEMKDLDEAIVLQREALALCSQGRPGRSMPLNNFVLCLSNRFSQLGDIEDLDEAIVLSREALSLRPQGHPGRSMSLTNLALCLSTRYSQLGAIEDLDEAIVLDQEALRLRPRGNPHQSVSLCNLALRLSTRYKQLGVIQDLEEAIVLDREALSLRPQDHPDRSASLSNLAANLSIRYRNLGAMEDLDEAIVLDREALGLRLQGHPDRSTSLNNLSIRLCIRYDQLGSIEDLDEAIVLVREALELRPLGHPDRSLPLVNLAQYLRSRFTQSGQSDDMEGMFGLYTQLGHMPQVVFTCDLFATKEWIRAAEDFQHPTLLFAYETSLRLLVQHLATLPPLPRHLNLVKSLTSLLAVDAFSACLWERAPTRAVELLEQGRGVFWSQLSRLRSPLDDVIASGPAGRSLVDEFTRLASLTRNALNSHGINQHDQMYHLKVKMEKVVANIRKLPGLSRFLLPSQFSDLQRAASGGPVIIVSASQYSCDALIVFLDRDPVHIPLQITREDVRGLSTRLCLLTAHAMWVDTTKAFASLLRKLWDDVVSAVVEVLQMTLPYQSRIWWCPTDQFTILPLHAAGPYRKGQRNLSDLYISSYTPTLTALIRARRPLNPATEQKRFIAIGQAKAAGESELLSVGAELDSIRQRLDAFAAFTRIDGEESSIPRVVEELGKNEWVHLTCHAFPDWRQPFESAFALYDGHFTVQRIIGCDLKNPEFAYLSASYTAVSDDEAIHPASAMQFAGFRSVIGTMWAVDDGATNEIASTFYRHMMDERGRLDHTRAALALNRTMKSARVPLDQRILYIHVGA